MFKRLVADRGIRAKIMSVALLLTTVTLLVAVVAVTQLASVYGTAERLDTQSLRPMGMLAKLQVGVQKARVDIRQACLNSNPAELEQALEQMAANDRTLDEHVAAYRAMAADPAAVDRFKATWVEWRQQRDAKLVPIARSRDVSAFLKAAAPVNKVSDAAFAELDRAARSEEKQSARNVRGAKNTYTSARTLIVGFLLVGLILALVAAEYVTRTVVGPLREVSRVADELGAASAQINGASQSLSSASNEQAASVEETSASVEQMASSINLNSDNAKRTGDIAGTAATEAAEGGNAVQQTVEAMKEIADKIAVIDDIAFQTNMLALNATIEAARAGEHGKGFAVVAAEVGKLAERSQVSAQKISELAASSVRTAEHAGTLLGEIVPGIGKTSSLVQEIAAASAEQTAGVTQINAAMAQVSQITQQTASSSEELAATAEEMSGHAETLQRLMRSLIYGRQRAETPRTMRDPAKQSTTTGVPPQLRRTGPATRLDETRFESFR